LKFEITEQTRDAVSAWLSETNLRPHGLLFRSRVSAVQLLVGHTRLESAARYLGIEVDDALEIAEQTGVQGIVDGGGRHEVAVHPDSGRAYRKELLNGE